MTEAIQFIPLLPDFSLHDHTCTVEQLNEARKTFVECMGFEYFKECYEAGIREFCEIRICR